MIENALEEFEEIKYREKHIGRLILQKLYEEPLITEKLNCEKRSLDYIIQ